jgi:hypothetical protein
MEWRCSVNARYSVATVRAGQIEVGTVPYRTAASHTICSLDYVVNERKAVIFTALFPIVCCAVDIRAEPSGISRSSRSPSSRSPHRDIQRARVTCLCSPAIPAFRRSVCQGRLASFFSVVRIDTIPSNEADARRYSTVFDAVNPATSDDANDLSMQFGEDIIDGKAHAAAL